MLVKLSKRNLQKTLYLGPSNEVLYGTQVISSLTLCPLELQCAIVNTIFFLKELYGYTPNVHLRHMYLRWNLGKHNNRSLSK